MISPQQCKVLNLSQGFQIKYYSNTSQMTHHNKDIVPGQYEGGFKLWDCTVDLAKYMMEHADLFKGKKVIDLGCGHGLLGILAAKLGAKEVCLQDYNKDVIEKLTIPTVQLNCQSLQKFTFLHGDWSEIKCEGAKYDILLGSELIYNEGTYSKLLTCITQFMAEEGSTIMVNKVYYFGVGGSMVGFRKALESTTKLKCQSLEKIVASTGGNKKEIVKIVH